MSGECEACSSDRHVFCVSCRSLDEEHHALLAEERRVREEALALLERTNAEYSNLTAFAEWLTDVSKFLAAHTPKEGKHP